MEHPRLQRFLPYVGVALVAIVVHALALGGEFVWDDRILIVQNESLRSIEHLWALLGRDFFELHDEPTPYGYYRPLVSLSYMLEYRLWGLEPFGYHLTNVLLHALNSVLVAAVLVRVGTRRRLAFAIALLFAVHPIHTESVAWIAGRTDLLAFAFTGLAFLTYLMALPSRERAVDGAIAPGRRAFLSVLSVICFALGLLAKEMAVVLVAWLPLAHRLAVGARWSTVARRLVPYAGVLVSYAALRFLILDVPVPGTPPSHDLANVLMSAPHTVLRYLGWMALPGGTQAYVQNPYVESAGDPRLLRSVAALLALALLARPLLRSRTGLLALGMLLTSFLPLLNLVRIAGPEDMGAVMAERFAYFPSFPFLAVLGIAAVRLADRWRGAPLPVSWKAALLGGLVAPCAVLAGVRTLDWRSDEAFVTRALAQSPEAPLLWKLRAGTSLRTAMGLETLGSDLNWRAAPPRDAALLEVVEGFRRAVELDPRDVSAHHNLGAALHRAGDLDGAIEAFRNAVLLDPGYARAHINLGAALHDRGEVEPALAAYGTAIELLEREDLAPSAARRADLAAARYNRARALVGSGDLERALPELRAALRLRPELGGVVTGLGVLEARGGRLSAAAALLAEVVDALPTFAPARLQLAGVLAAMDRTTGAEAVLEAGLDHGTQEDRVLLTQGLKALSHSSDPEARTPR